MTSGEITVGRLLATPGRSGCRYGATIRWADGKISSVSATGRAEDARAGKGLLARSGAGECARSMAGEAPPARVRRARPAARALAGGALCPSGGGSLFEHRGRLRPACPRRSRHRRARALVDHRRSACIADAAGRRAGRPETSGIVFAFVVPLRDCRTLGYGEDEDLLARHPAADREIIQNKWLYKFPPPAEYMALVREVARRIEGPMVSVQLGPNSPQACTDALLEATAAESADQNRRIQTHLLETATQRRCGRRALPSRSLFVTWTSYGVHRRASPAPLGSASDADDCRLLAGRASSIAINTSSNLRLRSGIAPVAEYIRAGMRFALGVDSSSFDDDDDAFREMRVTHWLHSLDGNSAPLTPERLFDAALQNGFEVAMNSQNYGSIAPDMPADFVIVDYDAMAHDIIDGMVDELDVLLTRATRNHVRHLFVNGRQILTEAAPLWTLKPWSENCWRRLMPRAPPCARCAR